MSPVVTRLNITLKHNCVLNISEGKSRVLYLDVVWTGILGYAPGNHLCDSQRQKRLLDLDSLLQHHKCIHPCNHKVVRFSLKL